MPLIASKNDQQIISRLKKLRLWDDVKNQSVMGKTVCWLLNNELFIWKGNPLDSGYCYFKCDDPAVLQDITFIATNTPTWH